MERSQLESLLTSDLKYYITKHDIQTAINTTFIELIDIILIRQANILSERARMAIAQLTNVPPGVDFTNIHSSELGGPLSSAYSSTVAGGRLYSDAMETVDGAASNPKELHIRKKIKKVCACC